MARTVSAFVIVLGLLGCGAGQRCVIDRGCPDEASVPACAAAPPEVLTPGEVRARRQELDGRRIAVRGVLRQVGLECTEMECGPDERCCNTCHSQLVLFPEPADGPSVPPLAFGWACRGDDTAQCCPYAPGPEPVVVVGTVVSDPGARLEAASVCAPRR
jgi:hypothetical protein